MKFDATRAGSLFRGLGDPRYAGPDGESRVADLVAGQFEGMGLDVERRTIVGSRFPQRAAPWVGWLVYGALLTASYVLILAGGIVAGMAAFFLLFLSLQWLNAVLGDRIRIGRDRPPMENASLVIALPSRIRPAPVRLVFLAHLGEWKVDLFRRRSRWSSIPLILRATTLLLAWAVFFSEVGLLLRPDDPRTLASLGLITRFVFPGLLVAVWVGIANILRWEYREEWRMEASHRPDRRGLAVLLEIARTWPKAGSRPIEPIFAAAGGERLDHAGCREIGRLLSTEWSDRPSLLILFLAPGAGAEIGLFTSEPRDSATHDLARSAAGSLWIPIRDRPPYESFPSWPFEIHRPAVALFGTDPASFFDDSVDPRALQHAAQLATEIAMRWARTQEAAGFPESGG